MADLGQRGRRAEALVIAWQLAGTWACGSLLLGTVALVFLLAHAVGPPLPIASDTVSLTMLTPLQRLAVFALVAALFVALGVIGHRTAAVSWLTGDTRARVLWVLVVGGGGLAGWGFAAAVTFAVHFGSATQLTLAYLAGGLPFTLSAAMLVRPWRVNAAAAAISVALVGAGYLMVAGNGPVNGPVNGAVNGPQQTATTGVSGAAARERGLSCRPVGFPAGELDVRGLRLRRPSASVKSLAGSCAS